MSACVLGTFALSSIDIELDTINTDSQTTQYRIVMKITGITHKYTTRIGLVLHSRPNLL